MRQVSGESGRSVGGKELLRCSLGDTVGQRELEVLGEELFDIWTPNIHRLFDFDDFEDLM